MGNDKNPIGQLKDLVELKDQLEDIQRRVENEMQAGIPPQTQLSELKNVANIFTEKIHQTQQKFRLLHPETCPQGGSLLASPFLKGFLAGYVVAKLRSSALMGVAVGTCTGIFAAQNYVVPNIEQTLRDYFSSLRGGGK